MLPILASAARKLNFLHAGTRAVEILRCLTRAHASYGTGYGALAVRFVDLYRSRKYSISEIAYLDLLNPRLTKDDLDRRQSKEQQLKLQLAVNPREYRSLAANKGYIRPLLSPRRSCHTPMVRDVRYRSRIGRVDAARERPELCCRALGRATAGQLIVKPVDGVYGEGVDRPARRRTAVHRRQRSALFGGRSLRPARWRIEVSVLPYPGTLGRPLGDCRAHWY